LKLIGLSRRQGIELIDKQHIAVFENALPSKSCQDLIAYFEKRNELGMTYTRQQMNDNPSHIKSDTTLFITETAEELTAALPLLKPVIENLWKCFEIYAQKYGVLVEQQPYSCPGMRLQKTKPQEGYHIWHSEKANIASSRRIMGVSYFLNTVEQGGETEFLYQSLRVPAVEGTLIVFPASFTHTHRGNPPLSGDKYLLTSWIEYAK
jgi:hypothetical protein